MRSLLFLLLLALVAPARAQYPFALGGTDYDSGNAVAVDDAGIAYVAGDFRDRMDVDPGPAGFDLIAAGGSDVFLAAYDDAGAVLWAFAVGGDGYDFAYGVAADGATVYVTGAFEGTVDFDPGPGDTAVYTAAAGSDAFLAAYDAATGAFHWVVPFLASGDYDEGRALAVDGEGVYVTGGFAGTADFDPGSGSFPLTSARDTDVFVAAYTADSAFRWAFNLGSMTNTGHTFDEGYGVATADGRLVVTGAFSSQVDFDPGAGTAFVDTGIGSNDLFVASYTTGGAYEWAFGVGDDFFDGGSAIALGPDGACYVAGFFNRTADFDPGPGVHVLRSEGNQDAFVAAYDAAGGFLGAFNLGSGAFENANAIAVGPEGHLYVGGSFGETVDFAPGAATHLVTATAFDDLFVASYTLDGTMRWVANAGAAETGNFANGVAAAAGRVLATGAFEGVADFDAGSGSAVLSAAGGRDAFVVQYSAEGAVLPVAAEPPAAGVPDAFALSAATPNPFASTTRLTLLLEAPAAVHVAVYDALGRRVALLHDGTLTAGTHPLAFDAAGLPSGAYVVVATGPLGTHRQNVTVVR